MNCMCNYLYPANVETLNKLTNINYEDNRKLLVLEYNNSYVLPEKNSISGVVTEEGNFVKNTSFHSNLSNEVGYEPRISDFENIIEANESVVYIGSYRNCWGHTITDSLKHLWFLFDENYSVLKNLPFVYTGESIDKIPNLKEIFIKLGINLTNIKRIDKACKFKKVFVPDDCFSYNLEKKHRTYTKEYCFIIEKLRNSIEPKTNNEKIYFSRTAFKRKKIVGEIYLEKFFKSAGFIIVHPEQHSMEEQISILKGCKFLVASQGSLAHNALFLENGSKLVILKSNDHYNGYQPVINQMKNLDVCYVDSHKSILLKNKINWWDGPFCFYLSKPLLKFASEKLSNAKISTLSKICCFIDFIFNYYLNQKIYYPISTKLKSFSSFIKQKIKRILKFLFPFLTKLKNSK